MRNAGNISSNTVSTRRGVVMEETERSLTLRIEGQYKKNPLSLSIIQGKALSLYDDWKKRCGEEAAGMPEFQASKGFFDRFKSRDSLHNIKLTGESGWCK